LLNSKKIKWDVETIGLTQTQKDLFLSACAQPQGLILVTGPTGSGKTMTLYTALHFLNHNEKNISSVEDPVEIELTGINQVNINPRIGLTFASVLRALLRQDPDIIMVGEIRDTETAHIALQAAQTGHLVLSTLHTNNAIESIFRLQSMGTPAHHFMSSITLIIAQRLMRKLCQHCKQSEILPANVHDKLNLSAFIAYRAIGCEHCHQGYSGRIGIFEFIPITEKIAQQIVSGASIKQLLEQIKKEGWMLLWQAGLEKVLNGITSYTELLRVVGHFS
jgi:type IV pilus assembly protein PilB